MENDEKLPEKAEIAIKKAAILLLSERYRTVGAPVKDIERILRESGMSTKKLISILERRLNSLGLILKRIRTAHGSKVYDRYIVVTDPRIDVPEARPFDVETLAVLALIILRSQVGSVFINKLHEDLESFIGGDKEKAKEILLKSLKKLEKKGIIKINISEGKIELTELGKAISPPPELIDEMIINLLAGE